MLLVSVFLVATCGLVYELVAASLTSSLLGDSVLHFSTIIGAYLFSMGLGAYASRWVWRGLLITFLQLQYSVGVLGGYSALLLSLVYAHGTGYLAALYTLVGLIGALVGLEIPLLMRLLQERFTFRDLVSQVLALDYLGALVGSLLFPLFMLPTFGLVKTALIFGMVNVGLALVLTLSIDHEARLRGLQIEGVFLLALLAAGVAFSEQLSTFTEEGLFVDKILLTRTTPYQRIVVTQNDKDVRLHLNNNLQFSSRDEYRYHEALVIPALRSVERPAKVVILGGGDGLAAALLLLDPRVEQITLVELDPAVTELFSTHPILSQLNGQALKNPKVKVVHQDAFIWLESTQETFDLAIVDFPDPSNYAVGKLYTKIFYQRLRSRLNSGGALSVQCSSPLLARRTFWCVVRTVESAGLQVRPYHAFVPSFGEWGFCLAAPALPANFLPSSVPTRFLDDTTLAALFEFPKDMAPLEVEINQIFDQQVVRYFRLDWADL